MERACCLIDSSKFGVSSRFRPICRRYGNEKQGRHRTPDGPSVALRFRHAAECVSQSGRNRKNQDHLEEIRKRRRIFVGMSAICIEEPAAIRAKHFDDFLRRRRADGNHLLGNGLRNRLPVRSWRLHGLRFDELRPGVRLQGLHHALRNQNQ